MLLAPGISFIVEEVTPANQSGEKVSIVRLRYTTEDRCGCSWCQLESLLVPRHVAQQSPDGPSSVNRALAILQKEESGTLAALLRRSPRGVPPPIDAVCHTCFDANDSKVEGADALGIQRSLLMMAASIGAHEIVQTLLDMNADVERTDVHDHNSLQLALLYAPKLQGGADEYDLHSTVRVLLETCCQRSSSLTDRVAREALPLLHHEPDWVLCFLFEWST